MDGSANKSSSIKLYHGANAKHEFWQSEDTHILILRVHQELAWSSHKNVRFVGFHNTAEEAARLGTGLGTTREYREINGKFQLLLVAPPSLKK